MSDVNEHAAALNAAAAFPSEQLSRRLRLIAWLGLPLLGTLYYLILVSPLPPLTRLAVLELIYCTPIALTVIWGLVARSRSESNERRFWGYLSAALFVLLLCEVLLVWWVAKINPAGPPRVSWPFHVLHAIAATSFIGALFSLSRFSKAPRIMRIRWTLDITLSMVVAGVLLLEFYVRPVMGADAPIAHVLLGLGYAIFALLMAGGTLGNVVGFKVDRWRPWDKMFALALVIYAVGTILWPAWYQTALDTSRNYERGVLDLVQFGGHWLLMAAAVYRLTEVKVWELRPLPPVDTARRRWVTAVTPTVAFIGVPAAAIGAYQAFDSQGWFSIYLGFFTIITALALAHSVLISLENGMMFHQSTIDPLTGVANHRAFHEQLVEEFQRAKRYGSPLSVIRIDLDSFGAVNAERGHEAGDDLLKEVAGILRGGCSRECTIARLSGDDFAIIAPEMDAMAASIKARRLLDYVSIKGGSAPGELTASAGIGAYPQHGEETEDILAAARVALFRAKAAGPDSLSVTSEP